MPSDTWPWVLSAAIGKGPGSTAPGSVTTTLSPTSKLAAPQTTPRTSPPPSAARSPSGATRTRHHRMVLPFDWGSGVNSRTSPTTTGPETPKVCSASSSRPTLTRAAWRPATVMSSGRSTYSPSQLRGTRMSAHHPELRAEADVALGHVPHVVESVPELQGALDPHAEREALVLVGVDSRGTQHVRVDHAAAAPLDPSRAALGAGLPHVHLGGGLGEGEVVGAQADLRLVPEHDPREVLESAAQVRHGEALVDGEALELREDGQVRGVELVGPIDAPGAEHVDGQVALDEGADLHGRGVRAQHQVPLRRVDEEGVLHGAGRGVLGEVEGVEVDPRVLELGPLRDLPAHADEDVAPLLLEESQRV